MAEIQKGVILTFNEEKTKARVKAIGSTDVVSRMISIPWYLRSKEDFLKVDAEVAFAVFEDQTGLIISKLDGEWSCEIEGPLEVIGKVNAADVSAEHVSLKSHTHSIQTGSGVTGEPV